jgi:hypothetical protein
METPESVPVWKPGNREDAARLLGWQEAQPKHPRWAALSNGYGAGYGPMVNLHLSLPKYAFLLTRSQGNCKCPEDFQGPRMRSGSDLTPVRGHLYGKPEN